MTLELWDNFPHDAVRRDPATGEVFQSWVIIDRQGDMFEHSEPALDPVVERYLNMRSMVSHPSRYTEATGRDMRTRMRRLIPGTQKLSPPEWLPTQLMEFFDVLHTYFPAHCLISADFSSFETMVKGVNAPMVHTRFKGQQIGVGTVMV